MNITIQRDLLEGIFMSMIKNFPCIPESFLDQHDKPTLEWCTMYMEDRKVNVQQSQYQLNKIVPKDIMAAFRKLKESTSQFSHLSDRDVVKIPFLANTFLLLEILEWLPSFADEYYHDWL
jgi:hypothetical protein